MLTATLLEQQFRTCVTDLIELADNHRSAMRDTPGKTWNDAWNRAHRAAICATLKVDRTDPLAFFATFPFRVIRHDDANWIGGAIGCESLLKIEAGNIYPWSTVTDVILWQPRTNELRLLGEAPRQAMLITPDNPDSRLTVYSDGYAFFRAWTDARSILVASALARREQRYSQPVIEPRDNCLPGALAIGDIDRVHWRDADATVLVAGPGVDPTKLKRAVFRAARLPRIEAAA